MYSSQQPLQRQYDIGNGFLMILSPLLFSLITRGFLQKKNWMRASIAGRSNTELFSCWRENSHKMCVLFECNWKQVHTQSNLFIKSQKWACAAVAESKRTAGSSYMLWIEILINVFLKAVSHTETHPRTREKKIFTARGWALPVFVCYWNFTQKQHKFTPSSFSASTPLNGSLQ